MSAMHWEARRRQSMLDRRIYSQAQKDLTEPHKTEQSQPKVPPVASECIHCKHGPHNDDSYSVKIEKRYTSTQYSQQW